MNKIIVKGKNINFNGYLIHNKNYSKLSDNF